MPIFITNLTIMKKFIILVMLALSSCVKDDCVDYLIENKTNNSLEIISFEEGLSSRNVNILPNSTFSELSICDWGGNAITYSIYDSIQVKVENIVKKTYYPSDTGKSIFKTQDLDSWKLVESRDNHSKFVFEITETDLQ